MPGKTYIIKSGFEVALLYCLMRPALCFPSLQMGGLPLPRIQGAPVHLRERRLQTLERLECPGPSDPVCPTCEGHAVAQEGLLRCHRPGPGPLPGPGPGPRPRPGPWPRPRPYPSTSCTSCTSCHSWSQLSRTPLPPPPSTPLPTLPTVP